MNEIIKGVIHFFLMQMHPDWPVKLAEFFRAPCRKTLVFPAGRTEQFGLIEGHAVFQQ